MKLSIIIPTLNEELFLPKLLNSIKEQGLKDLEVIVADANSKDKTVSIAKKFGCKVVKGGLPAVGRNAGAKIAKSNNLLFLDADVVLPKNFLKENLKEFIKRKLDAGTPLVQPITEKLIDKFIHGTLFNLVYTVMQFINPHACGFCIFSTKQYFDRVNGFDETIKVAEDHNFVSKTKRFRVLHGPKIMVSIRRLNTEGRLGFVLKTIRMGLHRFLIGEIRTDKFEYSWDHKEKIKS